ncbi:MAG TPA: dockerin type I repeat-containing protein [Tepidisphaeraceae bacterium]|jgi:hypothetical protein|nr:dockerin type I repeat-containing protein [Tepidisphaeraceae bacterium]
MTAGQLSSYSLQIGYGSTSSGSMTQSGGQNTAGTFSLGYSLASAGSYVLSGTAQLTANTEFIGSSGTGVFTQTGGTNRPGSYVGTGSLYLGYQSGGQGTYNLSGNGQLLGIGSEYVGYGSTATGIMTQTGGINSTGAGGALFLGYQSTATGIYQLSGTGLLTTNVEYIGYTGSGAVTGAGIFEQSGGTNTAQAISIGSNGRFDMTGGVAQVQSTFAITGNATIGDSSNPSAAPSLSTSVLNVGYSIFTGAGSLTLLSSSSVGVATGLHVYPAGSLTIKSGSLTAPSLFNEGIVSVSGTGSLAAPQGTLQYITGAGSITVGAGATVQAGYLRQSTVTVSGKLQLKHSGSASSFTDLSIPAGGSFVLADDLASWNYTGASPAGILRQYLQSGYNGGDWSGPGLSSSAAAGDVDRVLGVGYAEASAIGAVSWGGVSVDPTTLLLKIVPLGDANMDGTITADDFTLFDRGLALGTSGWSNGDFNYDGVINAADSLILDRTYAIQQGTLTPLFLAQRQAEFGDAYVSTLLASVPEPGSATLFIGGLILASRRLRRRQ